MPFIIDVLVLPKWPIFGITEKCTFFKSVDLVVLGSSDTVPAVNKTQKYHLVSFVVVCLSLLDDWNTVI